MAKGHLAPSGDFVYVSSKWSSYFYINAVPQWNQINNINWRKLENRIRNVAANLNNNLIIYTGAFKNLTLPDSHNTDKGIFLMDYRVAAPKYIWKVVHSLTYDKAIAFVTVNNPFQPIVIDDLPGYDNKICEDYKWDWPERKDVSKGFTYCCSVDALRNSISNVPHLDVTGILNGGE